MHILLLVHAENPQAPSATTGTADTLADKLRRLSADVGMELLAKHKLPQSKAYQERHLVPVPGGGCAPGGAGQGTGLGPTRGMSQGR